MMFNFFKKKSAKNIQNIDNHLDSLVQDYIKSKSQNINSTVDTTLQNLTNKELFLSHLSTGYKDTYQLLLDYFSLNNEVNNEILSQAIWKEKTKKAESISHELEHHMDELLIKIERGGEKLDGICDVCKDWRQDKSLQSI